MTTVASTDSHPKASTEIAPAKVSWVGYTVPAAMGLAIVANLVVGWTDHSQWSEMPCLVSHTEEYQRPDDRPHKQGGRGGMITSRREVCDERATIGPVLPHGWTP